MAIFLVDLQFREKAKQMLSSREMFAVVLFLMFALLPWVEIMETAQVKLRTKPGYIYYLLLLLISLKVMTNSTWWDINAYTMVSSEPRFHQTKNAKILLARIRAAGRELATATLTPGHVCEEASTHRNVCRLTSRHLYKNLFNLNLDLHITYSVK